MTTRAIFRYIFAVIAVLSFIVISVGIATHTSDSSLAVIAQNTTN